MKKSKFIALQEERKAKEEKMAAAKKAKLEVLILDFKFKF